MRQALYDSDHYDGSYGLVVPVLATSAATVPNIPRYVPGRAFDEVVKGSNSGRLIGDGHPSVRADAAGDNKFIERSCVEESVGMKVTTNLPRSPADILIHIVELLSAGSVALPREGIGQSA